MRAAALFVELTLFSFPEPKTSAHFTRSKGGVENHGEEGGPNKRLGKKLNKVVMVFRALLEFIKRVIHLIVGLLKLSYRKVIVVSLLKTGRRSVC